MKTFKLKDSFNEISVKAGETFAIEMTTNPSTGYNWSVEVISGVLRERQDKHTFEALKNNAIGGSCTLKMVFQVRADVEPGDFSLVLSHGRAWNNAPDKVVPFNIKVV